MSEPLSAIAGFALGAMSTDGPDGSDKGKTVPDHFVIARWPTGHTLEVDLTVSALHELRRRNSQFPPNYKFIVRDPAGVPHELELQRRGRGGKHLEWRTWGNFDPLLRGVMLSAIEEVISCPGVGLYGAPVFSPDFIQTFRIPVVLSALKLNNVLQGNRAKSVQKAEESMKDAWQKDRRHYPEQRRALSAARAAYTNHCMDWIDILLVVRRALKGARVERNLRGETAAPNETHLRTWSLYDQSTPTRFLALRFVRGTALWNIYTEDRWVDPDANRTQIVTDASDPYTALLQSSWIMSSDNYQDWIDDQLDLVGEPEKTVDVRVYEALGAPNPYFLPYNDFVEWARNVMRGLP
jgi:hypothetical protein